MCVCIFGFLVCGGRVGEGGGGRGIRGLEGGLVILMRRRRGMFDDSDSDE